MSLADFGVFAILALVKLLKSLQNYFFGSRPTPDYPPFYRQQFVNVAVLLPVWL